MECGPRLMDPVEYPPFKCIGVEWNGHETFFPSHLEDVARNSAPVDAIIKEHRYGI